MKVVLFCGGQGMRLRDYSEKVPKPMVPVGNRPILWHVMKYYALYGHTDFILALGHRAAAIKEFFLNYEEAVSNDFVLRSGGREKHLLTSDIDEWTITFVDTGYNATVGQRLQSVRQYLEGEEMFLVNYADGVTDLDLNAYIDDFKATGRVASLLAVRPQQTYHVVTMSNGEPKAMGPIRDADLWLNGGYFVFRPEVFDYLDRHEDLTDGALEEMVKDGELYAHRFEGFWSPMDTFKDKQHLDGIFDSGEVPWLLHRLRLDIHDLPDQVDASRDPKD
ncbi:MAG: sugar phosphate nucleotidyltransferase [Acidimicrobiia bacterium]